MSTNSTRRRVLTTLVIVFLSLGLGTAGIKRIYDTLDRQVISWLTPRPDIPTNLNAPPVVDASCYARLAALPGVRIERAMSSEYVPGCLVDGAVYAHELAGLPFSPRSPLLRCEVAEKLHEWLEESAKPAAAEHFQTDLRRVGHLGTYNCRTIGGNPNVLSQHAFANAIDIAWFDLGTDRRIQLIDGWTIDEASQRQFWRRLQRGSCRHFDVSLGPSFNRAHANHFHFDLGPARACK